MNKINISTTKTQTATCDELDAIAHDYLGVQQSLDDESMGCRATDNITLPSTITATDGVYSDTKEAFAKKNVTVSGTEYVRIIDTGVRKVLEKSFASYSTDGNGKYYTSSGLAAIPYGNSFNGNSEIVDFTVFKYFTKYGGVFCNGYLFQNMTNMKKITIPPTFTVWGQNGTDTTMWYCNKIEVVDFNNIQQLANSGLGTWGSLSSLKEVYLTKLKSVGYNGFPFTFNNKPVTKIHIGSFEQWFSVTYYNSNCCPSCAGNATLYIEDTPFGDDKNPIVIPNTITTINAYALYNLKSCVNLYYAGTVNEWLAVSKGTDWHYNLGTDFIQCSDGKAGLDDTTDTGNTYSA